MFDIKQFKSDLEKLCDFTEIYDHFRLVNPDTSEVYQLDHGKAVLSQETPCYQIWNRDDPCPNCVSRRACQDETQYMKLEYLDGRVLMVVAKPIKVENRQFSLELVKDVTDSMVVQDEFHHGSEQIRIAELIEKVNRLSISDIFTGLYNNVYMKNKIGELTQSTLEYPFSILIVDIDQFKQVNDQYGHLAGDLVIQTIGTILNRFSSRPGCFVGRMGGDEYCVVFENCSLSEAKSYAEYAAGEISRQQYDRMGRNFTVEVTIGAGEYVPGEDVYAFIERVDRALYDAKHVKEASRLRENP